MANKIDSRQIISRDTLSQLTNAVGPELDDLLRSVNSELQMPLRMTANTPTNQILNIGASIISNADTSRSRAMSPIGSVVSTFVSGSVTFPTTSGGNITFSTGGSAPVVLTCAPGYRLKVLIYLDAASNLGAIVGNQALSDAGALVPPPVSDTFSIGYITMFNSGGTISAVSSTNIVQFVGGGGGSGGGGGLVPTPITSSYAGTLVAGKHYLYDGSGMGGSDKTLNIAAIAAGSDIQVTVYNIPINRKVILAAATSPSQQYIFFNDTDQTTLEFRASETEQWVKLTSNNVKWIATDAVGGIGYTLSGPLTVTGPFTPSGGIVGKTDGVAVAAGYVGQVAVLARTAVTASDASWVGTSALVTLGTGVWDIRGELEVPYDSALTVGAGMLSTSNGGGTGNLSKSIYGNTFFKQDASDLNGSCITICGGVLNVTTNTPIYGQIYIEKGTGTMANCYFSGQAIRIA